MPFTHWLSFRAAERSNIRLRGERIMKKLMTLLLLLIIYSYSYAEWVYVSRVIDGDTFVISYGTKIRVRGIDTPETKHPHKGKEFLGEEDTSLAKFFLEGNLVWIEGNSKDKYGRRVAKVVLPRGSSYADIVKNYGYDKNSNSIFKNITLNYGKSSKKKTNKNYYKSNPYHFRSYGSVTDLVWVDGYLRKDGTRVSGHFRKKSYSTRNNKSYYNYNLPSSSSDKVYIKGYYRKDGTYVKPHYRSKPKKK